MASTDISTMVDEAKQQVIKTEEQIVEGEIDTKDTKARYLGYLARVRPVLMPFTRYLAYTSDVGEAARPIAHPGLVTAAYGVSIAYLVGDVGYEGYKSSLRAKEFAPERLNEIVGLGVAKRALFQGTASMLFPALTIHSIVKYSAKAIANSKIKTPFIRTWGASLLGLSAIPALPYMFDEPVEHVVDKGFASLHNALYKNNVDRERIFKALEDHPHHPEAEIKK